MAEAALEMTPLQRAAAAVRNEIAYTHGDGEYIVEGGFRSDDDFTEVARAVIAAIREPSEAMARAGGVHIVYGDEDTKQHKHEATWVWCDMIDAMLEEGK